MSNIFSTFEKNELMNRLVKLGKTNVTAHIIVWAVILLFPMFVTYVLFGSELPADAYERYLVTTFCHLILFYLNYGFLSNRYLFRRKFGLFILWNLLAIPFLQGVEHFCFIFIEHPEIEGIDDAMSFPFQMMIAMSGLLTKIITILAATTVKGINRVYLETHQKELLEKEKTEAELKNLKDKLNPHFLFNALNNIYALTAFDPEKAQAAIDSLSKLLRYVLYENSSDMVPLNGELEFTRCYIDLMALRLDPSRSTLNLDIDDAPTGNYRIATLMFMTLIENSFKHGVSSREKSFIDISIKNQDREGQKWVVCTISNSLFPKTSADKSGSGIGLDNLKQRLELLYPAEYRYEVNISETDYTSILEVPLKH